MIRIAAVWEIPKNRRSLSEEQPSLDWLIKYMARNHKESDRLVEVISTKQDDIYVDPLVQPISTVSSKGTMILNTVRQIKTEYPNIHFTGGLSNISYRLPERKVVNRTFITLMMAAGC